mgnify:FL=1
MANEYNDRVKNIHNMRGKLYGMEAETNTPVMEAPTNVSRLMKKFYLGEAKVRDVIKAGAIVADKKGEKYFIEQVEPFSHNMLVLDSHGNQSRVNMRDFTVSEKISF